MVGSEGWEAVRSGIKGSCPGCPRERAKLAVSFPRIADPSKIDFLVVSQEPGHWLRQMGTSEAIESRLIALCKAGAPADEVRRANPLSKLLEVFGAFDPSGSRVYWTHALKCVPAGGDRDINKEWRKAATRCQEHLIAELRQLGKEELNIIAFGKYALEMCLNLFDGQDIDQELGISDFMQSKKLPLAYRYRFKDGTSRNIRLYVFTNPSSEVVKVKKAGGKMTVDEIQELEVAEIRRLLAVKR